MIQWDVYELSSEKHSLHGVKCRGRIRKYAVTHDIDLLVENATDAEGVVRIALVAGSDIGPVDKFVRSLFDDVHIKQVATKMYNPVLSKMDVNNPARYEI
jgi:hypothetical protein